MNQQIELHDKITLLNNLKNRLHYNDKQNTYQLQGGITQDEVNAIFTGIRLMQRKLEDMKVGDNE